VRSEGGVMHAQPLANWRKHSNHETSKLARSGEQIRDYLRLNEQFSRYPGFAVAPLRDMAALQALDDYHTFSAEGDISAAAIQLKLYRELVPLPERAARASLNYLKRLAGRIKNF
jgi:hypothetical protein